MLKLTFILLLEFFAAIVGNLIAAWVQQDVWDNLFLTSRLIASAVAAGVMLLMVGVLESKVSFVWSWPWHRFWYLVGLLRDERLRQLEKDFAPLEFVQGFRKTQVTEVIANGERRDLVKVLRDVVDGKVERPYTAMVLGEPGCGKTTALQMLTLELAKEGKASFGFGRAIPVFVALGSFTQGSLIDFIGRSIQTNTTGHSGHILGENVETLINSGRLVVLLDALDEALGEHRDNILGELEELLSKQRYKNVRLIITCRPREDPGERVSPRHVFEIQDLNDDAVNLLIRAYKGPEYDVETIRDRLAEHNLLETKALGRNPLFLKNMVELGVFERNRGQILNKVIVGLITREWNKPRSDRAWHRLPSKEEQVEETMRGLARLAYKMTESSRFLMDKDTALCIVEQSLKKRPGADASRFRPQDVLGMGEDAKILVYQANPVKFQHRQLQEFMAAWEMKMDLENPERSSLARNRIYTSAESPSWWETLFLTCGLISRSTFECLVKSVLGNNPNDQRLFAATLMLGGIDSPPEELSRSVKNDFIASIGDVLTEQQQFAAQELGRILGAKALETFNSLYQSSDPHLKAKGIGLLCSMRNDRADALLLSNLSPASVIFLAKAGEPALRLLTSLARNPDLVWQVQAAEALGEIRSPYSVSVLIHCLHNSNDDLHKKAHASLVKLGEMAVKPLIKALEDQKSEDAIDETKLRILNVLGGIGTLAFEPVFHALPDLKGLVYKEAISILGRIGKAKVDFLEAVLKGQEIELRIAAVEVLGEVRSVQTIDSLIEVLKIDHHVHDARLRKVTEEALTKVGKWALITVGDSALEPLRRVRDFGNSDPWLHSSVMKILQAIEGAPIEPANIGGFHSSWEALSNLSQSYFLKKWRRRRGV